VGMVIAAMTMSLDGFITGPNGEVDHLFKWYFSGDASHAVPVGDPAQTSGALRGHVLKFNREGAEFIEQASKSAGVLVTGRKTFDTANAWGGRHPMNVPIVVLTHRPPQEWVDQPGSPFTFVTDGIESAIKKAQRLAGDKNVAVGTASTAQQCLKAGLLDAIHVDLAPVLLGEGVPFFEGLGAHPYELECIEANVAPNVTHLTYRVIK
jgi:dihydrofolate reductase